MSQPPLLSPSSTKLVTLVTFNDTKATPIDSPRSLQVLAEMGIVPSDLFAVPAPGNADSVTVKQISSASPNGGSPEKSSDTQDAQLAEATLRWTVRDQRRRLLLEKAREAYMTSIGPRLYQPPSDDDGWQSIGEPVHASTILKWREEQTEARRLRQHADLSQKLVHAMRVEYTAAKNEEARRQRERAQEQRMQEHAESLRQRTQDRRSKAERRIQAALEAERKFMEERNARYEEKRQAQQRIAAEGEARRLEEVMRRREINNLKEEKRQELRRKADEMTRAQRERSLERIAQQEANLQEILRQRAAAMQERRCLLQLRNEGVVEAVQRQGRIREHQKNLLTSKNESKAARVEKMRSELAALVSASRAQTKQESETRAAIGRWLEYIRVSGTFEIPPWLRLDLTPMLPMLREEQKQNPDLDLSTLLAAAATPIVKKSHAAPPLPPKDRMYWAKGFFEA
eukprot:NODE_1417_length_1540_cov_46.582160_g1278_i0.p1 GENE.NODE_1417_length_1540_cov_46.582160_g1278_i0~~NODE_1417_length_1540_cov_46.582160_g1278_i0.p1  ORF type:complete len:472 (+),score=85.56 NODE_1417_length_1540_cov_46.582160_g1278_i0:46-1416(+)